MKIRAQYKDSCRVCGGRIAKGKRIAWSKAKGARHIECAKAARLRKHRIQELEELEVLTKESPASPVMNSPKKRKPTQRELEEQAAAAKRRRLERERRELKQTWEGRTPIPTREEAAALRDGRNAKRPVLPVLTQYHREVG